MFDISLVKTIFYVSLLECNHNPQIPKALYNDELEAGIQMYRLVPDFLVALVQ